MRITKVISERGFKFPKYKNHKDSMNFISFYMCKESWALKNWCFWTVVLEKTLESPLDCEEIKTVNLKGNQPWIFTGRTDAEAPIIWQPDVKNWLIGKDPNARKDWRQEEKGTTEDEMVRRHNWLDGHECEQALGDGEGQKSIAYCSPRGCKKSDTTEQLIKQQKMNAKINLKFKTLNKSPKSCR